MTLAVGEAAVGVQHGGGQDLGLAVAQWHAHPRQAHQLGGHALAHKSHRPSEKDRSPLWHKGRAINRLPQQRRDALR